MDRRGFLKAALALALYLSPLEALARQTGTQNTLTLFNTHTEEHLTLDLGEEAGYDQPSIAKFNHFMRCHHNGKVHEMDTRLIDMLSEVDRSCGGGNTIHVVSGFRSPEYNSMLARRSKSVAKKSLHMQGLAVDFRIPGVRMNELFRMVRSMQAGGAGNYASFVHMDTGSVRTWGKRA